MNVEFIGICSKPDEHIELEILKLTDLVIPRNAFLVYHYYYNLPFSFENIFQTVASLYTHTIPGLLLNQMWEQRINSEV